MSNQTTLQKIKAGQKRAKELEIKNADQWYHSFQNDYCKRLELSEKYKSPKNIPFGYKTWKELCEDIDKWGAETMGTYRNVCLPGQVKKPVFYKFDYLQTQEQTMSCIRIHNVGDPNIMVIEFAINSIPETIEFITNLLRLGSASRLQYLYTQTRKTPEGESLAHKKIKKRLCKQPTLDMLKIRLLWLFKAGYGVSFRH